MDQDDENLLHYMRVDEVDDTTTDDDEVVDPANGFLNNLLRYRRVIIAEYNSDDEQPEEQQQQQQQHFQQVINEDEDDDQEGGSAKKKTFDMTLSTSHSYLGNDLEVLRGRVLLDNGIYVNLPLWMRSPYNAQNEMTVLFPGQTLPILERNPIAIRMFRECINRDKTFGVINTDDGNLIGTTAEIYEYSEDSDQNQIESVRVKAKGRQRFELLQIKDFSGQNLMADVKILPEVFLAPMYYEYRLNSLNGLRVLPTNDENVRRHDRVTKLESAITPWPGWVYQQYDAQRLTYRIHNYLRFLKSNGSTIPKDPTELSYWVAQNLVMKTQDMISLLKMNNAIPRLQMEVKLLEKLVDKEFVCKRCRSNGKSVKIAKQIDLFPMNQEGLQSAYCNPSGHIHETATFYRAQSLVLNRAPPSTDYSWFPGYAWVIASCAECYCHIGWRFTATNSDLRPKSFWGLTRQALIWDDLKNKNKDNEDDDDDDEVTTEDEDDDDN